MSWHLVWLDSFTPKVTSKKSRHTHSATKQTVHIQLYTQKNRKKKKSRRKNLQADMQREMKKRNLKAHTHRKLCFFHLLISWMIFVDIHRVPSASIIKICKCPALFISFWLRVSNNVGNWSSKHWYQYLCKRYLIKTYMKERKKSFTMKSWPRLQNESSTIRILRQVP